VTPLVTGTLFAGILVARSEVSPQSKALREAQEPAPGVPYPRSARVLPPREDVAMASSGIHGPSPRPGSVAHIFPDGPLTTPGSAHRAPHRGDAGPRGSRPNRSRQVATSILIRKAGLRP
jgi:hypothetical protein